MIHLYFAIAFTVLALGVQGYSFYRAGKEGSAADPLLPAGLALAAIVSLIAPVYASFFLKGAVALALLMLAVGASLMLIRGTPQVVTYATNFLVHLLLWLGLLVTAGRNLWQWQALVGLLPLAGAAALGWWLRGVLEERRLGDLKATVLVYAVNLGLVLGAAAALLAVEPGLWSALALAGVLLLAGADAVRALDAWRKPIARAGALASVMIVAGSLLLAWAVWGPDGMALFTQIGR